MNIVTGNLGNDEELDLDIFYAKLHMDSTIEKAMSDLCNIRDLYNNIFSKFRLLCNSLQHQIIMFVESIAGDLYDDVKLDITYLRAKLNRVVENTIRDLQAKADLDFANLSTKLKC